MLPYRSLPEHIEQQLGAGRTVLVEIDGFYLPDTAATSYRREHLKTTVAPEAIDRGGEWMRYFHNAGYFELAGEDYRGAFRMLDHFTDDVMDPFTELVTFDAGPRLSGDDAAPRRPASCSAATTPGGPRRNPFAAWADSLTGDLPRLLRGHRAGLPRVRVRHRAHGRLGLRAVRRSRRLGARRRRAQAPAPAFDRVVEGSKTISFRLARRRAFDPHAALEVDDRGLGRGHGRARRRAGGVIVADPAGRSAHARRRLGGRRQRARARWAGPAQAVREGAVAARPRPGTAAAAVGRRRRRATSTPRTGGSASRFPAPEAGEGRVGAAPGRRGHGQRGLPQR